MALASPEEARSISPAKESPLSLQEARMQLESFIESKQLLGPGSRGSIVTAAQTLMKAAGSNLEVTGVWDSKTIVAFKSFQHANTDLENDSFFGPRSASKVLGKSLPPKERLTFSSSEYYPQREKFDEVVLPDRRGLVGKSHEEVLAALGINPDGIKKDSKGNLTTEGARTEDGRLQIWASGGLIGAFPGATGLAGLRPETVAFTKKFVDEYHRETGEGLYLTAGRDGKGIHASGSQGHDYGYGVDLDGNRRKIKRFLDDHPKIVRADIGYGKEGWLDTRDGTTIAMEGHFNFKVGTDRGKLLLQNLDISAPNESIAAIDKSFSNSSSS